MAKTFQTAELQRLVSRDAATVIKTMKSLGFRPVRETRTAARTYRWWSVEAKDALVAAFTAVPEPEAPPADTAPPAEGTTLDRVLAELAEVKGLLTQLLDTATAPSRGAAS